MALDDDAAAGQPLPATLGHFGRLAAAAAEQEHRKADDGGSGTKEVAPRGESPEPLRVRSPGSLREPSRSPPPQGAASEGERRFSHEPWNWKLGGAPEEEEEAKSADLEGDRDDRRREEGPNAAQDKVEHRGPQEQKISESLVA